MSLFLPLRHPPSTASFKPTSPPLSSSNTLRTAPSSPSPTSTPSPDRGESSTNVRSLGPGLKVTSSCSLQKLDNEYVFPLFGVEEANWTGAQVTLGSPDHVALIAFALFNVSVPRTE